MHIKIRQRFLISVLAVVLTCVSPPVVNAQVRSTELPSFEETLAVYQYGADMPKALRDFWALASVGDERAQFYVGYMLDQGQGGTGKDMYGATPWYRRSAESGYPPAMTYMGYLYSSGHGLTKNDDEAFKWYLKAAQLGDAAAQNNLGTMIRDGRGHKKSYTAAIQWYTQSAWQGNTRAQYNLATMYRLGRGVKANYSEALKWYTSAAEKGDKYAQNALGFMYYVGQGADADPQQALKWYQMAAAQDHAPSQLTLARLYEAGEGTGTDKSPEDAVIWYARAAKQGNAEAQYMLATYYEKGLGIPQDFEAALRWYKKAVEKDHHMPAVVALARFYEEGKGGVEKNTDAAVNLYRQGAESGDPYSQLQMGRIYRQGTLAQKDLVTAYLWFALAAAGLPDGEEKANAVVARIEVSNALSADQISEARKRVSRWTPSGATLRIVLPQ